jgi:hypothetical protein
MPNITQIIHLPEDAVWSLRKKDLRAYFLALQAYALNPHPLCISSTTNTMHNAAVPTLDLPPLLRLPLEIRRQIYSHCLSPPSTPPHRGPHPRQLQTHIQLTQSFPPSLLLINHQIHHEAVPILYGSFNQTVSIKIDYNVWVHKTQRSPLILSSHLTSSIKHIDLSICLGSEKRVNKPKEEDAEARITEVKKGVKKLRKWLAGAEISSLRVSWQEPPQTFAWEQKREVLDGLRGLRAERVVKGEINWGLNWNKGRRYRFEVEYLRELERDRQVEGGESSESLVLVMGK